MCLLVLFLFVDDAALVANKVEYNISKAALGISVVTDLVLRFILRMASTI